MKVKMKIIAIVAFALALAGCKGKARTTNAQTPSADTPAQEDSYASAWWNDPYADFPEELPPLSKKQLEKILGEIVEHEERIIARGESDQPVDEETFAYLHAHGNTNLVSVNAESPYHYRRIKNPNPKNGKPNFIEVLYARPTREVMQFFSSVKDGFLARVEGSILDIDAEKFADDYARFSKQSASFRTSVKIAGNTYEVIFTDIDDEIEN